MNTNAYTVGLDFGTDSVRALLVDARTGEEIASEACEYERWKKGWYCDAARNQFRQHPQDHLDAMVQAVRATLEQADGAMRAQIRGISVDTTGSTPGLVNRRVVSLCQTEGFDNDPNAMFMPVEGSLCGCRGRRDQCLCCSQSPAGLFEVCRRRLFRRVVLGQADICAAPGQALFQRPVFAYRALRLGVCHIDRLR